MSLNHKYTFKKTRKITTEMKINKKNYSNYLSKLFQETIEFCQRKNKKQLKEQKMASTKNLKTKVSGKKILLRQKKAKKKYKYKDKTHTLKTAIMNI